tara:strand:- start:599 stop:994 length:396 start_codon:yes stop_codon:yes gene_type:complete
MSTLAVGTIKSISSASPVFQNTSGTEMGQLARVWVCFNGTGTVAIRDSFNVSSITDNGTGTYKINFSTALSNTNFCVSGLGSDAQTQFGAYLIDASSNSSHTRTTSSVTVFSLSSSSLLDTTFNNVVVFGD